jgi:hypothetical protein
LLGFFIGGKGVEMKKTLILILLFIMIFAPYANANSLIGVNRIENELVSIDILTGAGTVIGSTVIPHDPEDFGLAVMSLAYDPELNVFYAVDNNKVDGSANLGRCWFGYGPYKPVMVGKLLDIFRIFYNFVEVGRNKQTPAMRLGLAKGKISIENIIYYQ